MTDVRETRRRLRWSRRGFVQGGLAAVAMGVAGETGAVAEGALTPEMFGARGDGRTNDSLAFGLLAGRINAMGGGTIVLRKAVYVVGRQVPSLRPGGPSFEAAPLLHFRNCAQPIVIEGNGAVLRCEAGLRFGTFDAATGAPLRRPLPYTGGGWATPYEHMISVVECGSVRISDLELDGNLRQLHLGGPYGDTGYQISGSGIYLRNNRGDEILRNIHTHHHPQDGVMIDGLDDAALARRVTRRLENVRCEYNARQGCSIVGGRGIVFSGCRFNRTGKGGLASDPGAGVDIEAEGGKRNVDFTFTDCEFVDNTGCGMVADSGPSEGATFTRCTFIGTTSWSAWPGKPRFSFRSCTFIGALCHAAEVADPRLATTFIDCVFLDDPAKSPTGKVYLLAGNSGAIADLNENGTPIFVRSRFTLTHNAQLPWSEKATYRDCTMSQASPKQAFPRGRFEGRNVIRGNVGLGASKVVGELILNGQVVPPNAT